MPPEISVKDMKETLQAELGAMFGEELRRPTRRDTAVVSVRLPENALQHLRDISKREGWELAQILRSAVADWLERYHAARRAALRRTAGLADAVATQALALFRELPEAELAEDEPVHFTVDDNSALIVRRDRDGVAYTLFEEHAVRMAVEGMHARITFYKAGRLVEQRLVPLVQPKNPATLAEGSDA